MSLSVNLVIPKQYISDPTEVSDVCDNINRFFKSSTLATPFYEDVQKTAFIKFTLPKNSFKFFQKSQYVYYISTYNYEKTIKVRIAKDYLNSTIVEYLID